MHVHNIISSENDLFQTIMTCGMNLDEYMSLACVGTGLIGKAQKVITLYDDGYNELIGEIAAFVVNERCVNVIETNTTASRIFYRHISLVILFLVIV